MFLVGMKLGIGGNATAPSGNTDSPSWQLEMLMLRFFFLPGVNLVLSNRPMNMEGWTFSLMRCMVLFFMDQGMILGSVVVVGA